MNSLLKRHTAPIRICWLDAMLINSDARVVFQNWIGFDQDISEINPMIYTFRNKNYNVETI